MQKILITGCSSGIGLTTALTLQNLGWQVIAVIRDTKDAPQLEERGIIVKYCDQTDPQQIEKLFNDPEIQTIDAVFLNAGYGFVSASEDTDPEQLRQLLNCNLVGTWDYFNRCVKIFRAKGQGRILITSSIVSFVAAPFRSAYGASKAGLDVMVKTFRIENDNPKIQVSLINPGPVISNFRQRALKEYQASQTSRTNSHLKEQYLEQEKRLENKDRKHFTSTPEDIAQVVVKALNSKKQKVHYLVGIPTHFMWYLQKFIPETWVEKFIRKTYKFEK
ncbi:hypothetical protein CKF54_03870 [Psittacicella hinzii]|uniref:Short-chain dehydrogenase n=1 Tax=Psittacicella hinzii TaxID=2028575 RepID=A0A3A1YA02_9GAMM|nr:SDR family NAD(P)-dependent oxidoreductase [Psittacicella hinzii]RIY32947.1 hypothetical protein CKF54_03870 [Psittacicella hinzii]